MGSEVLLVDSAVSILDDMRERFEDTGDTEKGKDSFFVSDNEEKFCKIAEDILNIKDFTLAKVRLGETWYIENKY